MFGQNERGMNETLLEAGCIDAGLLKENGGRFPRMGSGRFVVFYPLTPCLIRI